MNRWKDWYEQGERDLERAKLDIQHGYYEWACFTARQSSEKFLKALGLYLCIDLWGHSLVPMLKIISDKARIEADHLIPYSAELDKYFIPTRYPNVFASGKPSDYYTIEDAKRAIRSANNIRGFCERYISEQG